MGRFERVAARVAQARALEATAPIVLERSPWDAPTFLSDNGVLVEAAKAPARVAGSTVDTPRPQDLDEYGQPQSDVNTLFAIKTPEPDHIELFCLVSTEAGDAIATVRSNVWEEPLRVRPRFALKCLACGNETDKKVDLCPSCFAPADQMREPDEAQKNILAQWQADLNEEGDTLENFGGDIEDAGNKHNRCFIVFRYRHDLEQDGRIRASYLDEIRLGDPRVFHRIKDKDNRVGGRYFVCVRCRGEVKNYKAMETRGPCRHCRGVTYDAWYVELGAGHGGKDARAYYLPNEVFYEDTFHSPRGSSPFSRVWDKGVALLWMDKYVVFAYDPRRDKKPGKVGVIVGGDRAAIKAWVGEDAARRRENPYAASWLHIPHNGATADSRPDVKTVDLDDETIKGQSMELRDRFERWIRKTFGLTDVSGPGGAESGGGLNNEGLKLRVEATRVRHHQRIHQRWLDRLADALGVYDWRYEFEGTLEEEDAMDATTLGQTLDNAKKAADMGLTVRFVDGRVIIQDGEVEPTPAPSFGVPGIPGTGPGPFEKPEGESARVDAEPKEKQGDAVEQSAILSDDALPRSVDSAFKGPSGAVLAQDVLYADPFSGVSPQASEAVKRQIVDSMTQPQGWSEDSIARRIRPILEREGLQDAKERASLIARMEPAAMASELRLRQYMALEENTATPALYEMVGADDHRTTKLSRWIRAQTRGGKVLDEVLRIIDEGIELAKRGAFLADNAALSGIPGEPIRLPTNFYRRGTVAHFGERDVLRRIWTGGGS